MLPRDPLPYALTTREESIINLPASKCPCQVALPLIKPDRHPTKTSRGASPLILGLSGIERQRHGPLNGYEAHCRNILPGFVSGCGLRISIPHRVPIYLGEEEVSWLLEARAMLIAALEIRPRVRREA